MSKIHTKTHPPQHAGELVVVLEQAPALTSRRLSTDDMLTAPPRGMTIAIVPLAPPVELDLDGLAPWVGELVRWLGPGQWRPTLAGLICCAPSGLLDDARLELGRGRVIPVPWTLNSAVRHALLPLAHLSLVDGKPVSPELGATLVAVLADPRLGPGQRHEVETALIESEEFEGELEAESLGGLE